MKLYKMWSEQPHSTTGVSIKTWWWRYRSSPLMVDEHMVAGFTISGGWRQAAILETLGRYFTEEEVSYFKIYIENLIPGADVHSEELKLPLDERSLRQLRIEGGHPPGGSFLRDSPDMRSVEIYGTTVNDGSGSHLFPGYR